MNITVAYGDGIGPEIMESVLEIMNEEGAQIRIDTIEIGQRIYEKGWQSGITDSAWEVIKRNKILLKAPITTPQGKGVRSLNVTLRQNLGLFANVRPAISYIGGSSIDVVIIRENEEDLYTGIEYRQTQDSYASIKCITKSGSKRICRYAFEYARANNRKKVTVFIKDNIMKLTDGAFHQAFKEVAQDYPEIKTESYIIDIGAARLATRPQDFDVIVTENLYGDIISDVAAEVTGSVGLAGSANIGSQYAMFEAVHGSAPDIAGRGIANPSGLLNAAIYMLSYIGQKNVAQKIYSAWRKTIEEGIHTADIYNSNYSKKKVGTKAFTESIIKNLRSDTRSVSFCNFIRADNEPELDQTTVQKTLIGADIFISWQSDKVNELLAIFEKLEVTNDLLLANIKSKGSSIWPEKTIALGGYSDNLCCRFLIKGDDKITHNDVNHVLVELENHEVEVIKLEKLYKFDNALGFSL